MRNPRPRGADGAKKSQPCTVRIQRSRMDHHHGGRKKIQAVLVSNSPQKSIPGAAVVGPVADTDQTFAAVLQLLPSRDDRVLFYVEVEIRLPVIERVPHIGQGVLER